MYAVLVGSKYVEKKTLVTFYMFIECTVSVSDRPIIVLIKRTVRDFHETYRAPFPRNIQKDRSI